MVVPEYRVREIEDKAAALLRQAYCKVYPYAVPLTAIDVEWVAEATLGLRFRPIPGLRSRFGVDGLLGRTPDGRPVIVVDERLFDHPSQHRYRFTLAEEVGHYLLHFRHLPRASTPEEAVQQYHSIENWGIAERNAKRFAAALLMPMESVERQAAGVYAALCEDPAEGEGRRLIERLVAILVKIFRVSPEAMRHRLTEYPARLTERIQRALQDGLKSLPPRPQ